jgi:hypothetical protein
VADEQGMDFSKRGSQRWAFVRRLRPPKQLGGMIRWLFLLFATFNLVTAVPRILGNTHASPVPRAAGVAAALLVGIWWLVLSRLSDTSPI